MNTNNMRASHPRRLLRTIAVAATLLWASQLVAQASSWEKHNQGQGVAVPAHVLKRLTKDDKRYGKIDKLDASFRPKLQKMLDELRKQGWAARVAIGPRSLEQQIKEFKEGDSTVLRGSHLCGKAADISLYPMGMPDEDHRFWDIKDNAAKSVGLKVLPSTGSFIDRPHVALGRCTDKDWDRVGLSPAGTFSFNDGALRMDLVFKRTTNGWTGTMTMIDGDEREAVELRNLKFARSSGDTQKERFSFTVSYDGETESATGEFSSVKHKQLVRPDYRQLTLTNGDETLVFKRIKP